MNRSQRLYYDQSISDYEIFQHLEDKLPCHRLHYLQMCSEKIGKAYFYGGKPPGKVHTAFVKFLRVLPKIKTAWKELGFKRPQDLKAYIQANLDLARDIENLAPTEACAGDGPNPEYPWPPPPETPIEAPVHFDFPVWRTLQDTGKGRRFLGFFHRVVNSFPKFC